MRGASDPKIFEAFRRLRQRIKNWIRASRKAYLNSISSNIFTNPRPFWSFFKSKSKSSSLPETMFTDDKAAFSTDLDKAEAFSSFFCSIFTDHSCCSLSSSLGTLSPCSESAAILNNITFSPGEVLLELKRLKTSKSTGPDGLPARILVECATEIHSSVCELFNLSLSSGKFITEWKDANISPVFKKGSKSMFSNYRGISLLPILSKVLEKCVARKLVDFIDSRLFALQHSFRHGLSCTTQLLCVLHDIGRSLDRGDEIDVIYLDLTRAFDTVCHSRLLLKLQRFGIAGSLLSWFSDYLSSRQQRVVINGISSSWQPVISGVPQGSVLGPILFILYINDLPQCINFSRVAMFADDSKCYNTIRSCVDSSNLQSDLTNISNWASLNELSFQPKKCENLRISRKRFSAHRIYSLNNVQLKTVDFVRDLGVYISKTLLWSHHINCIAAKSNKMLGFLRRTCSRNLPVNSLRMLYIALVRSNITYASQVWAPSSSGSIYLMKTLEGVQRRASKLILHNLDLNYKTRLIRLKLLPFSFFCEYLDLLFLFRCLQDEIHLNIFQFVQFCSSVTRRGSSGLELRLLPARTSTFRDSYFVRICPLWNALPIEIRSSNSTATFKRLLRSLLRKRLNDIFDVDNIRTWRIICPLCRRPNLTSACTC